MKRKDAPQLFEIMRTTLSKKVSPSPTPKESTGLPASTPEASVPSDSQGVEPSPAPVSPPLILPPVATSVPVAVEAAVVESMAPPEAHPGKVEPLPDATESSPEASLDVAPISPPSQPLLPPEPQFEVPPPKPKPRPPGQPFVLKPPSPGLFKAGPEHRLVLSYPISLAAAALIFVLLFVAFAIGRASPAATSTLSPPPSSPAAPASAEHVLKIPETRPATIKILPPAPSAGPAVRPEPARQVQAAPPKPPEPVPSSPRWTIRLLEYDVTKPGTSDVVRRDHFVPAQKKILERYGAETRVLEYTRSGRDRFIGLFHGRWDSPKDPALLRIVENLRVLEPFDRGRKPFEKCQAVQEPAPLKR
jgi:hypothetical protein